MGESAGQLNSVLCLMDVVVSIAAAYRHSSLTTASVDRWIQTSDDSKATGRRHPSGRPKEMS